MLHCLRGMVKCVQLGEQKIENCVIFAMLDSSFSKYKWAHQQKKKEDITLLKNHISLDHYLKLHLSHEEMLCSERCNQATMQLTPMQIK